jgi:UDP-N-acetylglucosamine transferase subunit ALG13
MAGTFVSVGNSPRHFSRLLDEVVRLAPHLPKPVVVQHGRTPFNSAGIEHFEFIGEDAFLRQLKECELFITHGGGGSVLTAIRLGKTPVVIPRRAAFKEHVDDHQVALAAQIASEESIIVVDDMKNLRTAINDALSRPMRQAVESDNSGARSAIASALAELAPNKSDCIALVTPSGGHLAEIRQLAPVYRDHPHFFVINVPVVEPEDMVGRTSVITLSERDWKFLVNLWEALVILRRRRPKVLLTTGGGFSVAFTLVGKVLRIPTVYIETVGKVTAPTVTGRFMYRLANRFFYQWPNLACHFPRGEYIGLIL